MNTTLLKLSTIKEVIPPVSVKIVSLCLLWYFVSSLSSQLTKSILNDFPFPLALGECQFVIVFSLCAITTIILSKLPKIHAMFPPGSVPPLNAAPILKPDRHILITVLPLGCFQFLGKLFSHSATALVPVSTVAGVKTLSPLILVTTYRLLYNVRFPTSTYLSLIPLVSGILLIVVADTHDTLITTTATLAHDDEQQNKSNERPILPIASDHSREGKEIEQAKRYQSYELKVEKSQLSSFPKIRNKYDKLTLLLYCSAVGLLLSLPWFVFIEAPHFFKLDTSTDVTEAQLIHIPWNLLIINGFTHFLQSLIAFHLLGAIPTVSYSVASMMKKITIIVVSMMFTGHQITGIQFIGLSLTAIGLYSYDRWGGNKSH
ncbi:unnamed protein product [Wickerhamomyces anomalus]